MFLCETGKAQIWATRLIFLTNFAYRVAGYITKHWPVSFPAMGRKIVSTLGGSQYTYYNKQFVLFMCKRFQEVVGRQKLVELNVTLEKVIRGETSSCT